MVRTLPLLLLLVCGLARVSHGADASQRFVCLGGDGKLKYDADARGNRVPDFSHVGYRSGNEPLPDVPIAIVVSPLPGDNRPQLQAAIDWLAAKPADSRGFRGALLLKSGRYTLFGQLTIRASGIVLRGEGNTHLIAAGTDRRTLICVRGKADRSHESPLAIGDEYVPVGSHTLGVKGHAFKIGDMVQIEHPSTREWIAALGMDRFPSKDKGSWQDWKPNTLNLKWDRVITKIDGDRITVDAPITNALDAKLSRSKVCRYAWPGRIQQVGIENLNIDSTFDAANLHDEEHAWGGISFANARDCWVSQVTFAHLAGSAVNILESASRITVEDCSSTQPVSEQGGYRRHTFTTAGQQTLVQRCTSENGRHDFAVGYLNTGPTVFTHCETKNSHSFSGGIESWTCGVLFDNITMDGGGIAFNNLEIEGHGVGWATANSVVYQCSAPVFTIRKPPTAQNWAIGSWGQYIGDGNWRQYNEFVKPDNLFAAQLLERGKTISAKRTISTATDIPSWQQPQHASSKVASKRLALNNGQLLIDHQPVSGTRVTLDWWRGHTLPAKAAEMGHGITRFAPGRTGHGYTDDLEEVAQSMKSRGHVAVEHHWGLWYDRRRDDHQMIRRMDSEVWPPFYEQPWARSGQGQAWDGLSKYDLTKFNPWYFSRLAEFADIAEREGLVLVQQMYFQHNILEAGAHWADFPWRPANCLQATAFPEPPPYEGKKRIFMADAFYDLTNATRRDLHRRYIRQCLDVLGTKSNVIFQLGEEFTGPLSFVQFWLDVIAQWQTETGKQVLVSLSVPKDVQDAIVLDEARSKIVSIIDIKYWWPTESGLYAPLSNQNLAPRQQLREWKGKKSVSPDGLANVIRDLRNRFPMKAITVSLDGAKQWVVRPD